MQIHFQLSVKVNEAVFLTVHERASIKVDKYGSYGNIRICVFLSYTISTEFLIEFTNNPPPPTETRFFGLHVTFKSPTPPPPPHNISISFYF